MREHWQPTAPRRLDRDRYRDEKHGEAGTNLDHPGRNTCSARRGQRSRLFDMAVLILVWQPVPSPSTATSSRCAASSRRPWTSRQARRGAGSDSSPPPRTAIRGRCYGPSRRAHHRSRRGLRREGGRIADTPSDSATHPSMSTLLRWRVWSALPPASRSPGKPCGAS
jgi:hypothetical protein